MSPIKLAFNIGSFDKAKKTGCHIVDKTRYIPLLEKVPHRYAVLVRPHRFGKTLLLTLLRAYYDKAAASDFASKFEKSDVGEHPTPEHNTYCVIFLSLGALHPGQDFTNCLREAWRKAFLSVATRYPGALPKEFTAPDALKRYVAVGDYLTEGFKKLPHDVRSRICLLIDDYDTGFRTIQEAADQIAANRSEWDGMVKAVRIAIEEGCVRRLFVTTSAYDGIDKLTFATDITHHPAFSNLLGFSAAELRELIRQAIDTEACRTTTDAVFRQMTEIYKRFKFSAKTQDWVFPPTVSLYYLATWQRIQRTPRTLFEPLNNVDYRYVVEDKLKEQFIL